MSTLEKIINHKLMSIIRGHDTDTTVEVARILLQNDFNVVEVALNSPDAKDTLKVLKDNFGKDIVLGAGTILTMEDAIDCLDLGVNFILSPVYNEDILQFSKNNNMLYIPGCYTPTEIYRAHSAGAEMIKVFPMTKLEAGYIKDILAPMNDLKLLPTGGITSQNINLYFNAGAKAVGVSSALIPSPQKDKSELYKELENRILSFKKQIQE